MSLCTASLWSSNRNQVLIDHEDEDADIEELEGNVFHFSTNIETAPLL